MSLIKEFAIEPRVMATWAHFNSMWEDFGAGQGRLISKYPVLWKNKVDELARTLSKPVQATAISAKIRRDDHKFLVTGRTYRGNDSWLDNALSTTQPFDAIVASKNGTDRKGVLVAGEFAKDEPPYKVVVEDFIPRSSKDLAACAGLLLANCEQLQLVDPYFDPAKARFRNTFRAMLHVCNAGYLKAIEIHRQKPAVFIPSTEQAEYHRKLATLVPAGVTLEVFFWSQMPGGLGMHPRFLLTDLGGMHFENGLDEGEPGEKTLVKPLTHEIWQQCRSIYSAAIGTFALTPDCIVTVLGQG
jgi:hypothetical protein